jgi:hypothetical protein
MYQRAFVAAEVGGDVRFGSVADHNPQLPFIVRAIERSVAAEKAAQACHKSQITWRILGYRADASPRMAAIPRLVDGTASGRPS